MLTYCFWRITVNTERKRRPSKEESIRTGLKKGRNVPPRMMDDPINAPSAAVTGSLLLRVPHLPTGSTERYSPSPFIHISRLKKRRREPEGKHRTPVLDHLLLYPAHGKIELASLYSRVRRAIARKPGLFLNRPSINSWIHLASTHTLSISVNLRCTLYSVGDGNIPPETVP
jgi:hypothetical protein